MLRSIRRLGRKNGAIQSLFGRSPRFPQAMPGKHIATVPTEMKATTPAAATPANTFSTTLRSESESVCLFN